MANTGEKSAAAMQVIVLGSGGGPLENNTTAFLVRSLTEGPEKGSCLAVDAGVHLSAIVKILENHLPDTDRVDAQGMFTVPGGPFEGLKSPYKSAKAIAAHITTELISTYLITHPHIDHIAGFVVNTAAIQGPARAKRLAGLPSTIDAFKTHIFNNIIWPNLTDEGGANLVTYTRLIEGGSVAMGEGDTKGYQEISEGLSVKTWAISHGNCANIHQHRGDGHRFSGSVSGSGTTHSDRLSPAFINQAEARRLKSGPISHSRERQHDYFPIIESESPLSQVFEPSCVVDSCMYLIRDISTGKEIAIFGDIEPDSVSLAPRNAFVWAKIAPVFEAGRLGAMLIECSYDNSVAEDRLYGHMAPRYLIEELKAFAAAIETYRQEKDQPKEAKGWSSDGHGTPTFNWHPQANNSPSPLSSLSSPSIRHNGGDTPKEHVSIRGATKKERPPTRHKRFQPLKGLKIVIIHVKDRLDDGPPIRDIVKEQLDAYEKVENLGIEFVFPEQGDALYL